MYIIASSSNKRGAPKGELTLRTSVITHGSKGHLFYLVHTGLRLASSCYMRTDYLIERNLDGHCVIGHNFER